MLYLIDPVRRGKDREKEKHKKKKKKKKLSRQKNPAKRISGFFELQACTLYEWPSDNIWLYTRLPLAKVNVFIR